VSVSTVAGGRLAEPPATTPLSFTREYDAHVSAKAGLPLRDYQLEALAASEKAESEGVRRQLLVVPTGGGKTIIFAEKSRRLGKPTLVIAHRDELISQAIEKIRTVHPGAEVGRVQADYDQVDAPIVVASIQTLAQPQRLARLRQRFDLVIVDEAHHATADSYVRVLEHIGAFHERGPLLLGFTATPDRGDRAGLDRVFQKIVYQKSIIEMVEAGYLADLRAVQVRIAADFRALHTSHGDFSEHELEEMLLAANAPQHAVAAFREHATDRKALLFTPTVAVAKAMARAFCDAGYAAESVDGTTPRDERRAILARLRTGETQILANVGVLTEGYDEPSVDCVVVARPTKARGLYVQMIGRGTRLYPGKQNVLILDLVGTTTRHDLMTTATLFGVTPRQLATKTVTQALRAPAEGRDEAPAPQGEFVTRVVDAFRGRSLQWVKAGSAFALRLEDGWLRMETTDGQNWAVVQHGRDSVSARTVIAEGLSLGYAQGFAEDFARKHGSTVLIDPNAAWRKRPATPKQIEVLAKLRVKVPTDINCGDASDAITAAMASRVPRQGRRRW
jgi:ATP-dependent helicase IRC3